MESKAGSIIFLGTRYVVQVGLELRDQSHASQSAGMKGVRAMIIYPF